MLDGELIAYHVASFLCALFVLAYGADIFIDHTAIVASRTGIPQGVIALLTAGAEWEELAVVIASIARGRSSLALGNIVGSTISNILGAFSLGLLFHKSQDTRLFDASSKIYSGLLLMITTLVAALLAFAHEIKWKIAGALVIIIFSIYVVSIAWSISHGLITAPEESDDESSDSEVESTPDTTASQALLNENGSNSEDESELGTITSQALLDNDRTDRGCRGHSLSYHLALLVFGMLAVTLSAFVLSEAASNLAEASGISDVAFGVVILALATTVPEKFIAIASGARGQTGIMVANTVGSNIFLLSLCIGVLWLSTDAEYDNGSVKPVEVGAMFGAAVVLNLTIWLAHTHVRWFGAGMVAAYVAFLVLEFTVIHPVE